jgi:fimbrial chaperone protein
MKAAKSPIIGFSALVALIGGACASLGSELSVEPIRLEVSAPALSSVVNLHSDQDTDVTVQTRVMRWSQVDGNERLEPATDVVASPPSVKLSPHSGYVVRIVRTSKQPVVGEESYRLLVDQLPDMRANSASAIRLLIRQSIPTFFRSRSLSPANVAWTLKWQGGKLVVTATNSGDENLRIASLRLRDAAGRSISFGDGLAGYALGRSSMNWTFSRAPRNFGTGAPVSVTAQTDKGFLNARVK